VTVPAEVTARPDSNVEVEKTLPRRKPCECSYDPFKRNQTSEIKYQCSIKLALCNHITFPSFEMMTWLDDPSMIYYELNEYFLTASRHWATLIEISFIRHFIRPECLGWNRFGEKIRVLFYHDKNETPTSFKWPQLKPGNTLAILYPEKKIFLDGSAGIRQENLDSCYIFESSLENVHEEAKRLLCGADIETHLNIGAKELPECFNCGIKTEKLSQCSACRRAKYCSKECQVKAWKTRHKNLCPQSEVLLKLAVLPRYDLKKTKGFSFNDKLDSYLLPYKRLENLKNDVNESKKENKTQVTGETMQTSKRVDNSASKTNTNDPENINVHKSQLNNYLMEGKSFLEKKDFKQALASIEKVLSINPSCDEAYKYKGDALNNQGIHNEAVRFYNKAIELNPTKIDYFISKGNALLDTNDKKGALNSFEKALKLDPNNALALSRKGLALGELKDYESAIECYNKAIDLNPKPDFMFPFNSYGTYIRMYDPDQAEIFSNKGASLEALKLFDEALVCYSKAIELDSNNQAKYYTNKGRVLMELKNYDESLIFFDIALHMISNYKDIQINFTQDIVYESKGDLLMKMNKYSEAIKYFDKCIELVSEDAEYLFKKGSALLKLGYSQTIQQRQTTYIQAIKMFNKASKLCPNESSYIIRKGETLLHMCDFKGCLNCCNRAIKIEPLSHTVFNFKGIALFHLKDSRGAIESFNRAIQIKSDYESYHYNKGVIHYLLQNKTEAIENFKEANRLNHSLNIHEYPDKNSVKFYIQNKHEIPYCLTFLNYEI